MKIYTKTGDQGNTKLLYGDTVPKDSLAPEAYGSVDELVASLGLIRAEEKLPIEIKEILLRIQRELFIVGAELATANTKGYELATVDVLAATCDSFATTAAPSVVILVLASLIKLVNSAA